ncbi:response regulator transcription factor [[Clostridium] dakarense]|uniref:response regulator transcription factor n=1 Tax=Faecalimicrobium dakarense TaxID=1301100 RepID=UPI0004AF5A5A|nr:response regulator transcription factor [[Clostridium] dakarense]
MNTLIISKSFMIKESVSKLFIENFNPKYVNQVSDLNDISDEELSKYDFIFINIDDNNINDLKRINLLRKNQESLKILAIDFYKKESLFIEAVRLGIGAYISNIDDKEEFIYIVRKVIEGKKFYEGDLMHKALTHKLNRANTLLTNREEEVIKEVAKGFNNYKISENLSITEYTVKKHISSILQKLGLKNRQEIILYMQK